MPHNDWVDEIIVGRVRDVEHDIRTQPPSSILHVIGRDGRGIGGGFRSFRTSDIVRVIGTMGKTEPRKTAREELAEEREERRAERRRKRLARRKG